MFDDWAGENLRKNEEFPQGRKIHYDRTMLLKYLRPRVEKGKKELSEKLETFMVETRQVFKSSVVI